MYERFCMDGKSRLGCFGLFFICLQCSDASSAHHQGIIRNIANFTRRAYNLQLFIRVSEEAKFNGLMSHLSLGVLGSLQISVADTPVTTLESDRVRALLAYLAVEADRPHRRKTLVGLLWPEFPEQFARHNLSQALFNLRLAIGDHTAKSPHLLISRDSIQFNLASDYSLDLTLFNRYFTTCEKNLSHCMEDCSLRAEQLGEMVKLYRGEFLHQFFLADCAEFEEWTLVQRENLHQRVLEAYSYLTTYYELHRDFKTSRQYAARQLELDPWREEAHRQMMRVLAQDGQRSAALAQYETCRRVLAEELGVEPSPLTSELYEEIRLGTLSIETDQRSSIPSTPVHNLPVQLTPFFGREAELAQLGQLFADPECRCITLVGPGGIGKTRLALQAAGNHLNEFAEGVAFVPLASVGSAIAIIPVIAKAINFDFYGTSDPKEQLLNYLREKQMLLILDNVEQLLTKRPLQENFVELLIEILQGTSRIKLLITSREVLNLQEEWVYEVQGLAFPQIEQMEGFDEFDAIALFMQRAWRASPGHALNEADQAGVAKICRLVEGMPLAIEMAATWARMLSPIEIAKEIEHSLDFLSTSVGDLPERHRSMRVVFDYSWQMLSTDEQQALCKLSVFRGGFQRQAAEQVAGASLSILSTLLNRTLIRRTAAGRYNLHELVRQYSADHLATDPQARAAVQEQHYAYCLALVKAAEQELKGRNQLEWLGWLEQDHDNLRAALEWALNSDDAADGDALALRLAGALRWFWRMRGHFHEGRDWLMESLQRRPERRTGARAVALLGLSLLMNGLGDLSAARPTAEESAEIYRELGDQQGLAEALTVLGLTLVWQGEASLGYARLEEALSIYRKLGDRWGEALALLRLGNSLADYGGDLTGRAMLEECAEILQDLGEKYIFSGVLTSLGIVEMSLGDYLAARKHFEQSLTVAREIGHPWGMADALTNLGCVFRIQGEYSTAQVRFEESYRVYQEHGRSIWEIDVLCALAENAIAQGDFSTARFHLQIASNLFGTSENKWLQALVGYFRGLLAYYEGDVERSAVLLEETTALTREGQYIPDLARSLVALSRVRRTLGEVGLASKLILEALDLFRELGHKLGMAIALEELAVVRALQGDGRHAAMLFSTAHALREMMGAPVPPVDRPAYEAAMAASHAQLGETAFAAAWARATARPFQEAVEEILKADDAG
jgi:predicted ATPase/DNA-binding SARP family transcriptional activator